MLFKRTDNLTPILTSYDFLKCIAVLFMFADHIGAYFIQDEIWWRVVGRLGFPVWFFLAGYSNDKGIKPNIWLGAGILVFGNVMFGDYLFPANALVSFICIRIFMTHQYKIVFSNWELLLYATVAFTLLAIPTNYIFEYGTLAFLFAMFGYVVRNYRDGGVSPKIKIVFCGAVSIVSALIQKYVFGFNDIQSMVCIGLMGAMCFVLFQFRQAEYPQLTQRLPKSLTALIQFGGRYTLEIYVFHLLAIKTYLFFWVNDGSHHWFTPTLLPTYM